VSGSFEAVLLSVVCANRLVAWRRVILVQIGL
jgi:hypothetical protein